MTEFPYPEIATPLLESGDICGRCATKLLVLSGKNWSSECTNKQCPFSWCDCAAEHKKGAAPRDNCLAHWRCDCRTGKLCDFHRSHPELVVKRCRNNGAPWSEKTGFVHLYDQANQWLATYIEQRRKAFEHCGSCWDKLKTKRAADGRKSSYCPSGCDCQCQKRKTCYVHLGCSCTSFAFCEFHKTKRPDVAVALYEALPPNDPARRILSNGFAQAGIDRYQYIGKGARRSTTPATPSKNISTAATPPAKRESMTIEPRTPAAPAATQTPATKTGTTSPDKHAKIGLGADLEAGMPAYQKWLSKQPLSANSKRNYLSRVRAFIAFVKESGEDYPPLSARTKDQPVQDLKQHLKKVAKAKPATVNSYLAAIDNLYGFLELGRTKVGRDDLPQEAPEALSPKDQKKFLCSIETARRAKDKAIGTLLFYTGMRLSECVQLELDDVFVVGRKTKAIIRSGKGDKYREIPLNTAVCVAIQEWLAERTHRYAERASSKALFLNAQGHPLVASGVYQIIKKLGAQCGLEMSPHTLRHTCLTNLMRKQKNDVVLVSDIAGHRSLNSTRRYTLPSAADKAAALEALLDT